MLNKMARNLAFTKWAGMTHFKAPILNLYSHYITSSLMSFYILSIFLVLLPLTFVQLQLPLNNPLLEQER